MLSQVCIPEINRTLPANPPCRSRRCCPRQAVAKAEEYVHNQHRACVADHHPLRSPRPVNRFEKLLGSTLIHV